MSSLLKETDVVLRTKKNRIVLWNLACEAAFLKLKRAMLNKLVLMMPNHLLKFTIETDASERAVRAVLC